MTIEPKLSFVALAILALSGCASLSPSEPLRVVRHKVVEHGAMSDAEAQYALGKYYLGQNRAALALLAFTRAVEADPRHVEAYNARATAFVHLGDLERAESDLTRAIGLAPKSAHLRNNQGYLRILRENYEGAAESLRTAFELEPRNERVVANWKLLSARVATNPALAQALRASPVEQVGLAPARAPEPTGPVVATLSEVLSGPVINLQAPRASAPGTPANGAIAAAISAPRGDATTRVVNLVPATAQPRPAAAQERSTTDAPPASKAAVVSPATSEVAPRIVQVSTRQDASKSGSASAGKVLAERERKDVAFPSERPTARVEVANGNGMHGMAAQFSRQLALRDYEVVRISNAARFDYEQTRIYFRSGYLQQALQLSRSLPVRPAVMLNNDVASRSDLQVIVGRDLVHRKVAGFEESQAPLFASNEHVAKPLVR